MAKHRAHEPTLGDVINGDYRVPARDIWMLVIGALLVVVFVSSMLGG